MSLLETDASLTLHIKLKQTSILNNTGLHYTGLYFKTMTEQTNIS